MNPIVFRNVRRFREGSWEPVDLTVSNGRIASINPPGSAACRTDHVLDWPDVCVLPGLINAHDHLELNLFPRLGRPPYANSYEWSRDIYHPSDPPMSEVLAIPLADRLLMGGYKNLLSGVTTVCHHNPYHQRIFDRNFPVRVVKNYRWAHSLGFGKDLEASFTAASEMPWIIHAAEGVDGRAAAEIRELETRGLIGANTVIVHGVALDEEDIAILKRCGASLIWCPSSNLFLFGDTAAVDKLRGHVPVALGSDSTLSADGDLLDELRAAASVERWPRDRLFDLVTTAPAQVLRLGDARSELAVDAPADLMFVTSEADNPSEALLATHSRDIRLVMCRGLAGCGDVQAAPILCAAARHVSHVAVDGTEKLVAGRFDALLCRLATRLGRTHFFGHEFTLDSAGRGRFHEPR